VPHKLRVGISSSTSPRPEQGTQNVKAISPERNSFVQKISGSSWIRQWLRY
jgi:hypothetical protein